MSETTADFKIIKREREKKKKKEFDVEGEEPRNKRIGKKIIEKKLLRKVE